MSNQFSIAARKTRRRLLGVCAAALLLSACGSTSIHSGAGGTKIEAQQVVALVYAQAPDSEIEKLLYSGGDLTRAIRRLRDRYPQLKPWLDQGVIGNTANGLVTLRDAALRDAALRDLVSKENRDRTLLYRETSNAVGQDDEHPNWLAYVSFSFGSEWIGQGPAGWWWMNEKREWLQK
ncbi:MAG: YdbL family protein [Sulfuritalea sp.]|jgi:hypothetical protein|nr:YdbL family protein [Sulfuritalea sp.]